MRNGLFLILLSSISTIFFAQETDTLNKNKTGFGLGFVPIFAFDSDVGLKTGIAANIFHYGNGENYPKYEHSLLLKWYRTTKGSRLTQVIYDSDKIIENVRLTSEFSYITDQTLGFYGFNGSKSFYNTNYEIQSENNTNYISKIYYKYQRKMLRFKIDFQYPFKGTKFKWLIGFSHYNIMIQSVDRDKINSHKSTKVLLPDTATLYDKYVKWGIIKNSEKNGGKINYIKSGIIYDSRDNTSNCNSGIWTEILLLYAPSFSANKSNFGKLLLTHRQYFPLKLNKLTFAYRLSYQTKLWGEIPYYMLPFFIDSKKTEDGLGGAKNLRGILRNRIVSNGFVNGTMELRWKFWSLKFIKQDFYLSLNCFTDVATVTEEYKFNSDLVKSDFGFSEESNLKTINYSNNKFHFTYGVGVYIVMNKNFVISTDYGRAVYNQDGKSGIYVGLDFIF